MSLLDDITRRGNRGSHAGMQRNNITCADGFTVSVIAGAGAYSTPRTPMCIPRHTCPEPAYGMYSEPCTYSGPYSEVEVGFPSECPEPWDAWADYCADPEDPTDTVYNFVPVDLVRALVASHGGEA